MEAHEHSSQHLCQVSPENCRVEDDAWHKLQVKKRFPGRGQARAHAARNALLFYDTAGCYGGEALEKQPGTC